MGILNIGPPINTVSTSAPVTECLNYSMTPINLPTTGATNVGVATGLPTGVTAFWSSNAITNYGTPTSLGTYNYQIPLTGGCGNIVATGAITLDACTVIDEAETDMFSVFPNPNSGDFVIQSKEGVVFEFRDITGKLIRRYTIDTPEFMVTEKDPFGVYFIREQKKGTVIKLIIGQNTL